MSVEVLQPCPFCGGELSRTTIWDEEGVEAVACDDCEAFTPCGFEEQAPPAAEWFFEGRRRA